MPLTRTLTVGLSGLALLGATAGFAQRSDTIAPAEPTHAVAAPGRPALEPGVTSVRLLLGMGDTAARSWSGSVQVDRGEVLAVEGGRFRKGDNVSGPNAWKARSLVNRKAQSPKAAAKKKATAANPAVGGPGNTGPTIVPTVVLVDLRAPADATLTITTEPGTAKIPLSELANQAPRPYLNGQIVAQRVPQHVALANTPLQEDFPAAVADGPDRVWVAYVAHAPRGPATSTALSVRPRSFADYVPSGGGDQIRLTVVDKGTRGTSVDVTAPGRDVWRPSIARDGKGRIVVVWAEFRDGDFDLFSRTLDPASGKLSDEVRLTSEPGADGDTALATTPDGTVHVAWQRWRDGKAEIALGRIGDDRLGQVRAVSRTAANDWSPALAADASGNLWVAFDTYETGGYDVRLVQARADGTLGAPIVVAGTTRYEARPTLAVDRRNRVWVAYEERTDNWGKDAENLVTGAGSTLYRAAAVRVRCLDGERLLDAGEPIASEGLNSMNSVPRLVVDAADRVWLAFRHRQEAVWGNNLVMVVGGVWVEYLTTRAAGGWTTPQPLPSSDGLLDNRPALVADPGNAAGATGRLTVVYNSDGRLRREVEHRPELTQTYYSHSGTPPGVVDNDLFMAWVDAPATAGAPPAGALVTGNEPEAKPAAPVHPNEAADVARLRAYRVQAGGSTYQLLRGEFHRHTELSQDGGSDGMLEDMWRYAIDVADFDWIGNGDHDNGGGKEYTWWLVQKTTDLYHSPRFSSMFTYERSVSYPHGHRNVMFDKRGVRTLPRLVMGGQVVDQDTPMLYDYLKEMGGLCASHTSATGMGTDWRDMNPTFEPMVEIFQGHRQSYEHLGAPRGARRPGESIGGWQPLGMVWNALAMQYRIGFQASSDHISTHISYAVALAEEPSRTGVLDAFRRRHCYGATDNIILDVRTADGQHIMGDEFDTPADGGPVRLKIAIQGTAPLARVDVIKDFVYVYSTEPKADRVSFEWTDNETRAPGLSWYYVRAVQTDGQIAWGSPMWVRSFNRAGAR